VIRRVVLTLSLWAGGAAALSAAIPNAAAAQGDTSSTVTEITTFAARADTVRRKRPVAVEYSDWYARRLAIHRWASYATLPLFAANYVTGSQLLQYGNQAPAWAINTHGPLATAVTALFAVNTLTGGWNLIDGRNDPAGRGWRTTHALLMLTADAGFAVTGMLASKAERSDHDRRLHRTVALGSIGLSTISYVMMLRPFRRD
jgi:hypothetical protein